jgi:hypothetical protein
VSYNGYYASFPSLRRGFDSLHPHQPSPFRGSGYAWHSHPGFTPKFADKSPTAALELVYIRRYRIESRGIKKTTNEHEWTQIPKRLFVYIRVHWALVIISLRSVVVVLNHCFQFFAFEQRKVGATLRREPMSPGKPRVVSGPFRDARSLPTIADETINIKRDRNLPVATGDKRAHDGSLS